MFQGAFSARSTGTAKNKGFSLTDLVVSLLLIAAITVLSIPTIQALTPDTGQQVPESSDAASRVDSEQGGREQ
jgi:competence protein ComGC